MIASTNLEVLVKVLERSSKDKAEFLTANRKAYIVLGKKRTTASVVVCTEMIIEMYDETKDRIESYHVIQMQVSF